ncbi:MAG TPA: Gfo/Idh/MocA family oxidoreductase [Anaerolineae bacterium]|nr:Gfo/Idh/MocA family oxidoreductase [Anaerolineae bacterium]HQH38128.1 Gfo/Idh/MocA family oxidoreductase [Anaerolineae bacterium]
MADKVRIGIIGVGIIGKSHLRHYQQMGNVEVVAAVDIDVPELNRVTAMFGIPHAYTKFDDLLAHDEIEAVDVCLHNNLHMTATVAALKAGKHVYCEKPIAGCYADGLTMVETAKAAGKMLHIQLATLYSNETKAAKYLLDRGALGKVYHARSSGFRRRGRPYVDGYATVPFVQKAQAGGGAFFDMGVYHIAQILYLLNNPQVLKITGKTYQETAIDPRRRDISGYDVEELGMGFVRLENNIALDIVESWAIHLGGFDGSYIVGAEGGVRLDPFGYYFNLGDLAVDGTVDLEQFNYRLHNVHEVGDVYDSSQHHWIAALQGRVELLPTAALALNTMLISEGIYLSEKLGREVTADEVKALSKSTALPL